MQPPNPVGRRDDGTYLPAMSPMKQPTDWRRRLIDRRLHCRGDARGRAELAERYLPLARSLAWRYRNRGEPLEDLVQVAMVGLVKAINRWDPGRGLEFSSFAVPTIVGELRRHFRDRAWTIRPPRRTQELFLLVARARRELWAELGRAPRLDEIAQFLDRRYEDVLDAVDAISAHTPRSLQAGFPEASDTAPLDEPAEPDAGYARAEDRVLLDGLLRGISRRSREVLRLRFHEDLKQREIAERIGCSQMHVSRILSDALETLRELAERNATMQAAAQTPLAT